MFVCGLGLNGGVNRGSGVEEGVGLNGCEFELGF